MPGLRLIGPGPGIAQSVARRLATEGFDVTLVARQQISGQLVEKVVEDGEVVVDVGRHVGKAQMGSRGRDRFPHPAVGEEDPSGVGEQRIQAEVSFLSVA